MEMLLRYPRNSVAKHQVT